MLRRIFLCFAFVLSVMTQSAVAAVKVNRLNPTAVEIRSDNGQILTLDFYGPTIVRLFMDPKGGGMHDPVAMPPAKILVDQPRRAVGELTVEEEESDEYTGFRCQDDRFNDLVGFLIK